MELFRRGGPFTTTITTHSTSPPPDRRRYPRPPACPNHLEIRALNNRSRHEHHCPARKMSLRTSICGHQAGDHHDRRCR